MAKQRFRTAVEAECVRTLTGRGWRCMERTGNNHLMLRWPPSGATLLIPSTGAKHHYKKIFKAAKQKEATDAII